MKTLMSYKETLIEKDIAAVNYNKKSNEQTDILLNSSFPLEKYNQI
jgi:hypothetical protein